MFKVGDKVFYNFPAYSTPCVGEGVVVEIRTSLNLFSVMVLIKNKGHLEKGVKFPFKPEELTLIQRKPVNLGDFL